MYFLDDLRDTSCRSQTVTLSATWAAIAQDHLAPSP
jgi:hypothetical protein